MLCCFKSSYTAFVAKQPVTISTSFLQVPWTSSVRQSLHLLNKKRNWKGPLDDANQNSRHVQAHQKSCNLLLWMEDSLHQLSYLYSSLSILSGARCPPSICVWASKSLRVRGDTYRLYDLPAQGEHWGCIGEILELSADPWGRRPAGSPFKGRHILSTLSTSPPTSLLPPSPPPCPPPWPTRLVTRPAKSDQLLGF